MNPINNAFPLHVVSGRVKVDIPTPAKKVSRVIYGIFDSTTDQVIYVGKTGQQISRRISWYTCMVNKSIDGKPVERKALIEAIAANVENFYFKIISQAGADESLSTVEEREIEGLNPTMNLNRGGGGGSSLLSPSVSHLKSPPHHFGSPITPQKNYPLTQITPSAGNLTNVIYRIKKISTGEVYIGQTSTTLYKRMSSHMSRVRADESTTIKSALHKMIAENPDDFNVGIVRDVGEGFNLDRIEDEIITHAKSEGGVLNKRRGGGGSKSSRAKRPIDDAAEVNPKKKLSFQSPRKR